MIRLTKHVYSLIMIAVLMAASGTLCPGKAQDNQTDNGSVSFSYSRDRAFGGAGLQNDTGPASLSSSRDQAFGGAAIQTENRFPDNTADNFSDADIAADDDGSDGDALNAGDQSAPPAAPQALKPTASNATSTVPPASPQALKTIASNATNTAPPVPAAAPTAPKTNDKGVVLVGAGDIGWGNNGDHRRQASTAKLIIDTLWNGTIPRIQRNHPWSVRLKGGVFTTGDNAQNHGTAKEYAKRFHPYWGRFKSKIRPSPGNHDYGGNDLVKCSSKLTSNCICSGKYTSPTYNCYQPPAVEYYKYLSNLNSYKSVHGHPGRGYYSYAVGTWHVLALNSNLTGSDNDAQMKWLKTDLDAHKNKCIMAYWHHPLFSTGPGGSGKNTSKALWDLLYKYGTDIIVNGHVHMYERFAPQTSSGVYDKNGIREFVVGTGGMKLHTNEEMKGRRIKANSQVRDHSTLGIIKLTLKTGGYNWKFVPVPGGKFTDSGSDVCSPNPMK